MPLPWAIPPGPRAGVWALSAPGQAAFGEVIVYDHPVTVTVPPYVGQFVRVHQAGVNPSFDALIHNVGGSGDGPGTNVVEMDCRLLCRVDPTATVHLMSLEDNSNLMFWTGITGGNFTVHWVSTWTPYLAQTRTVTIPVEITAATWVWLRQRVTPAGDLVLDYSLEHASAAPVTWTVLGTWAVSSLIVRPSFGDGKPWVVGIALDPVLGGVAATGSLELRRISYSFNGASPVLSTFETDPAVVDGASTRTVKADTANGNDYLSNTLTLPVTVESE